MYAAPERRALVAQVVGVVDGAHDVAAEEAALVGRPARVPHVAQRQRGQAVVCGQRARLGLHGVVPERARALVGRRAPPVQVHDCRRGRQLQQLAHQHLERAPARGRARNCSARALWSPTGAIRACTAVCRIWRPHNALLLGACELSAALPAADALPKAWTPRRHRLTSAA
jgi:hypothetical protein